MNKNVIVIEYARGFYTITLFVNNVYQDNLVLNSLYEALESKLAWLNFLKA